MKSNKFAASLQAVILLFFAALSQASETHWSYSGEEGPEHWGALSPEFKEAIGKAQSPVDLDGPEQIAFHYLDGPFSALNNGHTIQAVPDDKHESHILLDGTKYYLQQLHFHTPSEHTVKGAAFPMEAHFVHRSCEGKLAVVSVFIDEGEEDAVIQSIWDAVPKHKNVSAGIESAFALTRLLPGKLDGVRYSGSLTTPPTTEGVSWIVLTEHIQAGAGQIGWFTDRIGRNARPVQPRNGRTLTPYQGLRDRRNFFPVN